MFQFMKEFLLAHHFIMCTVLKILFHYSYQSIWEHILSEMCELYTSKRPSEIQCNRLIDALVTVIESKIITFLSWNMYQSISEKCLLHHILYWGYPKYYKQRDMLSRTQEFFAEAFEIKI